MRRIAGQREELSPAAGNRIGCKLRSYDIVLVCVDPQAREVVGEGVDFDGLWTAYSINKEDIGVTFAPTRVLRSASSGPG